MDSQSEFYTYLQGLDQSLAFEWDYFNIREAILKLWVKHNSGIIMSTMASQITGLLILNLLNRLISPPHTLFYVDIIAYPWPNPGASLARISQ